MRLTRLYLPTLKEVPAEAEVVSHQLMLRAGMIRKLAAGVYSYLPLGLRALRKVEQIIREEMDRAGGQEVFLPGVQPAELWEESGRWAVFGKELLKFKDRHDRDFCLGPTHEEVITDLVRHEVRSYRQLPLLLYQIQNKFRDEVRPRFGLMRGREFGMKDAYSFDADDAGAERSYQQMYEAYSRIFERCRLRFRPVEAETGAIGGSFSHEFMVLAETGEDSLVSCTACAYAANVERAEIGPARQASPAEPERPLEKVATPGMKTVEEVSRFLGVEPRALIKTLLFETEQGPVAVLVRGDHQLNEGKLRRHLGCDLLALASESMVEELTGAPMGFAGPVGLKARLLADQAIRVVRNGVSGANERDAHLVHVNHPRDFQPATFADLRVAAEGDPCARCGGEQRVSRGIEVGHIFKLGTKYSEAMGATFLDEAGRERPMVMGCYGIGTGRTVAAAIEQNHDEHGIIWPVPLAPYQVYILPINVKQGAQREAAEGLYRELTDQGLEVLLDDRDERPGSKFHDADLIGIPIRITLGDRALKGGRAEVKRREAAAAEEVPLAEVGARVLELVRG
ncbi:MAG: proline--tRNA ligase [Deltaproteobacteria bacterium]|nr:proline--tRNA ligase [Deltaproteobacteria bacterium]